MERGHRVGSERKVWDDVNFDNLFTTIKDTETESTTEQATE